MLNFLCHTGSYTYHLHFSHKVCLLVCMFVHLSVCLFVCLLALVIAMNNVNGSIFVMDMNWVFSEVELDFFFKWSLGLKR